jgi:Uma2 family endonuclease
MGRARAREPLPGTLDEFVAWHERQPERWEFVDGEPMMMAPGSRRHTVVKGNIFAALRTKLAGTGCTAYVDGIELRGFEQSAIPDVLVSCAPPDFATPVENAPVVVVEVASRSSFTRDMLLKWAAYRRYETLQHYPVVHPTQRCVILHTRDAPDVFVQVWRESGTIDLPAIGTALSLDEIFEGVPEAAPRQGRRGPPKDR